MKLCSAGSSTDSYGRMSTTPGQKEHALSDPSETISVMSTFSVAAAFISLMSFEFGDIHLSLRFRVRLVWNFGNCSYTHTHLAHTCTHLPPSVLTPPPVDDFWGPHNGRQATWARLSCLSAGVGVCCASVCVCRVFAGFWFGMSLQPALSTCTTLNKQTGFYFGSFVYRASAYLHCLFGRQLLRIHQLVLKCCLISFQMRHVVPWMKLTWVAVFSLTPFQMHVLERNME